MGRFNNIRRLFNLLETQESFGYSEEEWGILEQDLNTKLPKRLRDYYLTLGRNVSINYTHNRLLKLDEEIGFSTDKYLIFYEENQGGVYWGIMEEDLLLDNPPVWGNYGNNEVPDWQFETKTTEDFFLLMAIYNGTLGGLQYHANRLGSVAPRLVEEIKKNWKKITTISWERQQFYTNDFDEVISLSFDEGKNCTAIFIGTSHKEQFDSLLNFLKLDWSYVSYEDA